MATIYSAAVYHEALNASSCLPGRQIVTARNPVLSIARQGVSSFASLADPWTHRRPWSYRRRSCFRPDQTIGSSSTCHFSSLHARDPVKLARKMELSYARARPCHILSGSVHTYLSAGSRLPATYCVKILTCRIGLLRIDKFLTYMIIP